MTHQTMPTSSSNASSASSSSQAIVGVGDRGGRVRRRVGAFGAAVILGSGVGCSVSPPAPPQAPPTVRAAPPPTAVPQPVRSRWIAVDWAQLPGWHDDRTADAWAALLRGCDRAEAAWRTLCAEARLTEPPDDRAAREWLMQRLQPYRVEAPDGNAAGMITGYFEPLIEASRQRSTRHTVPLYAPPADLSARRPWFSRAEIGESSVARAALRGREIAWVQDPLDALLLHIQGSGLVQVTEPDGRVRVRLAYAGHNGQPYKSVGRWLIDKGELPAGQASWPQIKAWTRANPARVDEMLWANPRVVFFREEPLPDPTVGPRGAMGVPLTPERSIAVDPQSIPYGTQVWLDTTEPLSSKPLQRLVTAQDTGSAIVGAVRADYFWGWGEIAEAQAGRMKQPLRMWALWPRN